MINPHSTMKIYTKPIVKDICLLMDGPVMIYPPSMIISEDEGGDQLTRRQDPTGDTFNSDTFWDFDYKH